MPGLVIRAFENPEVVLLLMWMVDRLMTELEVTTYHF